MVPDLLLLVGLPAGRVEFLRLPWPPLQQPDGRAEVEPELGEFALRRTPISLREAEPARPSVSTPSRPRRPAGHLGDEVGAAVRDRGCRPARRPAAGRPTGVPRGVLTRGGGPRVRITEVVRVEIVPRKGLSAAVRPAEAPALRSPAARRGSCAVASPARPGAGTSSGPVAGLAVELAGGSSVVSRWD